ncbi:hypothetical protein PUMCH_003721 [Australozyma saopauloensis]|uniref:2-deoxyglucose-6-phosphate phosphatase n=1 Tax=Australozyma saopauloensis TaxID=291208 RepID=A0AAX4HDC8_9ASCO|nr:hypothetical protein PUMCH_003721 [[Candida] saopauloensis]
MPELEVNFLLFDLDGTLVNSTPAVEKTWSDTVTVHNEKYPESQIDLDEFLHQTHGSRTVETFRKWFPYRPAEQSDIAMFEQGIVTNYGSWAKEVDGASRLLTSLTEEFHDNWAIVTSGTTALATGWIKTLFGEEYQPSVFITADLVGKGKPDPEGYRKAFELLRLQSKFGEDATAVVFEDAPTGIAAGVAAGFPVIGLATTFLKEKLLAAGASYVIEDLTGIKLSRVNDRVLISF